MDCLYSIDLNPYVNDILNKKCDDKYVCALSNKNLFAFATDTCVFILPIEKPNELIPIDESNTTNCIDLCWSDDGIYLLVVYKNRICNIFQLKNGLINKFESICTFQLLNVDALVSKFLSKSPKYYFNWEKRDSINYLEKYQQYSFSPLKTFGNYTNNAFVILTKTGKLYICIIDYNTVKAKIERFDYEIKFDFNDNTADLADIIYDNDGNLVILCTKYDINAPVHIYYVNIQLASDSTLIGNHELKTSFCIKTESTNFKKSHILFCQYYHTNSLCIGLRSNETRTSVIEFWNQSSDSHMINYDDFETHSNGSSQNWSMIKHLSLNNQLITGISVPKFPIFYHDLCNNVFGNYANLIVVTDNGTIHYFDRVNYNQTQSNSLSTLLIDTNNSNLTGSSGKQHLIKRFRGMDDYFLSVDQSFSGCVGVGLTNTNRIILFRQHLLKEFNQNYFANLYEYMLLSGYDYWDLLINTKQKHSDAIIERLEERYNKQPLASVQRSLFKKFNSMLFSLARQSTSGLYKSTDILAKLELNRCLTIISHSVQLINIDSSLSISTATTLNDCIIEIIMLKQDDTSKLNDILNTILSRTSSNSGNTSQNPVNSNQKLIVNQQLKHIFQWIIDLSLYLTTVYSQYSLNQKQYNSNVTQTHFGLSLLNDQQFLNDIRKSLIYIKLLFNYSMMQNNSNVVLNHTFLYSSLPILPLKTTTFKDQISDLYQIYTKLIINSQHQASGSGSSYVDELLIDQCLNIQAETLIKPIEDQLIQIRQPWLSCIQTSKSCLQLTIDHLFNDEKYQKPDYPLFDIMRLINFPRSQYTKQCIRCANYTEALSSNNDANSLNLFKINTIYLLDSCSDKCICGGLWFLSSIS